MDDEAMFRAGDVMAKCWQLAAGMSDEQLDQAIADAIAARNSHKIEYKRFLWWKWETKASKLKWEHLFNVGFYLEDARKIRQFKKRLGITERDIALMSKHQWMGFLQSARA